MTRDEEQALLARTAKGDEEAFTVLFRLYHQGVYRFAHRMTGSVSTAEDITQEVFMVLMRRAGKVDLERGDLGSFLRGVARNHVLRHLRGSQRFLALDSDPAEEKTLADPDTARVQQAVHALPDRYREAVVLCHLNGLKQNDAAALLGVPPGTIASRLSRAIQLLTERFRAKR